MEVLQAHWLSRELPNETLLRECLSMDMLCPEGAQLKWVDGSLIGFLHPTPTMHWSRSREYPWALGAVSINPTDRILDAAGAHGPLQYLLAQRTPQGSVTNADLTPAYFDHVRRHPLGHTVQLDCEDLTKMTYVSDHFDKIYCISVLEHIPEQTKALAELLRVLKPGGHLVLTCDVQVDWLVDDMFCEPRFMDLLTALRIDVSAIPVTKDDCIGLLHGKPIMVFCAVLRK